MKVLIAGAEVSHRLLQQALGKRGYPVVVAQDGDQAWAVFQGDDSPGLAILDRTMPGLDTFEVCRRVRALAREPSPYIILLTGQEGKQDVIEGLRAGADDYLGKPVDPGELEARVRTGRRIVQLQAELVEAHAALRHQASRDPLTGLQNRGAIVEFLRGEMARSSQEGWTLAVALVDLDHFQQVNQEHGQAAGDAALREAASRLRGALRANDRVGRYGGEEFLIVFSGCDAKGGARGAERLRGVLSRAPLDAAGVAVGVTASFGDASLPGASDPTVLLQRADEALSKAKRDGGNRVGVMDADAPARQG
jgi:two-component system cell cycle response regulator